MPKLRLRMSKKLSEVSEDESKYEIINISENEDTEILTDVANKLSSKSDVTRSPKAWKGKIIGSTYMKTSIQDLEQPDSDKKADEKELYSKCPITIAHHPKSGDLRSADINGDENEEYMPKHKNELREPIEVVNESEIKRMETQLIHRVEEENTECKKKILQLTEENQNWFSVYLKQQQEIQSLKESLDNANNELSQNLIASMEQNVNQQHSKFDDAMIKYDALKQAILPSPCDGKLFAKLNVRVTGRNFNPDCPYNNYVSIAEAHFRRMSAMNPRGFENKVIDSIDIVHNPSLEALFISQKEEFKERNIDSNEVLAFHGTQINNIDNILEQNLNQKNRQAMGEGYYFSEFPDVSLGYGDLILFRVLPGKEWVDNTNSNIPPEYNSKKVINQCNGLKRGKKRRGNNSATTSTNTKKEEYGEMLVVNNNRQFMPYLVYNLTARHTIISRIPPVPMANVPMIPPVPRSLLSMIPPFPTSYVPMIPPVPMIPRVPMLNRPFIPPVPMPNVPMLHPVQMPKLSRIPAVSMMKDETSDDTMSDVEEGLDLSSNFDSSSSNDE